MALPRGRAAPPIHQADFLGSPRATGDMGSRHPGKNSSLQEVPKKPSRPGLEEFRKRARNGSRIEIFFLKKNPPRRCLKSRIQQRGLVTERSSGGSWAQPGLWLEGPPRGPWLDCAAGKTLRGLRGRGAREPLSTHSCEFLPKFPHESTAQSHR